MEHIDASAVGNHREVLLSELAGKATIVLKLKKYGDYTKNSPEVKNLIAILKDKERQGYEYEVAEASFDLLIRRTLGLYKPIGDLQSWHIESHKERGANSQTVGKTSLMVNGQEIMGMASCVGPVETIDAALRNALGKECPFLSQISLIDYRVRVLSPEAATAAKVRVFISCSDGVSSWDTVGVHQNIIEASWEALVDSYEYYYNTSARNNGTSGNE